MSDSSSQSHIRQTVLSHRALQNNKDCQQKSAIICHTISKLPQFLSSQRIALYYPQRGEVDLQPLMHLIWRTGKHCYLPVLHPFLHGKLHFRRMLPTTRMHLNQYNIPEPVKTHQDMSNPRTLDLVLTPLVAFDEQGHRMGMGGGYYDRTFWAHTRQPGWQRPQLTGVAFEFQKMTAIPIQPWDVPLSAIITEKNHYLQRKTT